MSNIFSAVAFFVVMVSLYCLTYYLNARTPKPKGCENLKSECEGCKVVGCANRRVAIKEGENHHA